MVEITSETIVSAVLKQLQKKFPTAKRYRDSQNQNIVRPCFFVEQLTLGSEKQMNNRARRNPRIKITYLGEQVYESFSKHLRSVGDKLIDALTRLPIGDSGLVFGRDLQYEIVAEELIFTGEYPMHVISPETPQPQQMSIQPNIDVK